MFYLYILQSEVDNSFYVGYTSDLNLRFEEHKYSKGKYTSLKKPWKLVYTESFKSKTEAIKRERYIKKLKSRKYIDNLINKGL